MRKITAVHLNQRQNPPAGKAAALPCPLQIQTKPPLEEERNIHAGLWYNSVKNIILKIAEI